MDEIVLLCPILNTVIFTTTTKVWRDQSTLQLLCWPINNKNTPLAKGVVVRNTIKFFRTSSNALLYTLPVCETENDYVVSSTTNTVQFSTIAVCTWLSGKVAMPSDFLHRSRHTQRYDPRRGAKCLFCAQSAVQTTDSWRVSRFWVLFLNPSVHYLKLMGFF